MPADKPRPTLADYLTIAVSPALIMAMIVSLVFFLLAVLYRGEFVSRLHTILFFFIFGMVLVARIAMETSHAGRAPLYGAVLALLVWIGMGNFVNYPPELAAPSWLINAGLIGLAWWLSYQLTHSCTYIDERAESTGTGVLEAAGLENAPVREEKPAKDDDADASTGQSDKKRKRPLTWRQRYERFRTERQKTQPPGVWVVYFALAALPIFGLGQALIDVADAERRRRTFWLMALYAASSLGLLVTTAFLGLRRYLRQRRLEMPKRVTAAWLLVGAVLVAAFIVIGAVLPRPQSEFSPFEVARADSKELAASKHAVTSGEPGKGAGRPGAQKRDPKGDPAAGKDPDRQGKGGQGKAKGSSSKDAQKDAANDPKKKAGERQQAKPENEQKKNEQKNESKTEGEQDQQTTSDTSGGSSWLSSLLSDAAKLLKWIVFGILVIVTAFFILGGGLRYLANFCDWARRLLDALRRFWEALFGGRARSRTAADEAAEVAEAARTPFGAFANPFHDGRAKTMTPDALVRYSFEALEAWAGECACGRGHEETPIEFTARLAGEVGALDKETTDLGTLYARVLYARGTLSSDWRETLKDFWKRLETMTLTKISSKSESQPFGVGSV